MKILNLQYKGKIYRYQDAVRSFGYRKLSDSKLFRGVFPNWDNEARKPGRGFSFAFATPYAYQRWLGQVGQETINMEPDPEKRLIFINAWNEWAEGAHLEPDRRYGYAYLKATADALRDLGENDPRLAEEEYLFGRPIQKRHDTAVFLHLFYPELWDELCLYLNNLQGQFDLFVSIPDVVKIETQQFLDYHKDTYIFRCENRGRDISPFLRMFRAVTRHGYVQALKLHTKKSKHREDGDKWRADLYHKLMGSPEIVQKILNTFKQDHVRKVGIIAPEGHVVSSEYYLASNKENIARLARLANLPYSGDEFRFVGGSMFWFRMESLFLLSLLPLTNDNFEPEAGQVDGTLAHAMERFFGLLMAMTNHKLFVSNGQFVYPYETSFPPEVYAHARPHLAD